MAMFNFMAVFSKVSSYLAEDQCNLFCSNRIIDKGSTELQKTLKNGTCAVFTVFHSFSLFLRFNPLRKHFRAKLLRKYKAALREIF